MDWRILVSRKRLFVLLSAIVILSLVVSSFIIIGRIRNTALSLPVILVNYPSGGETFHSGETITISWKTINVPKNNPVNITLISTYGTETDITGLNGVRDTGNYKWTIPGSVNGSHEEIIIKGTLGGNSPISGGSSYFNITN
jgi:acetoacetate decarboxylase